MSNITDWIKQELYPALYRVIDIALPELQFKSFAGGWRSPLKMDGTKPKQPRRDKTVVSRGAPGMILEQGGPVMSLVDYVIKRDNIELIEACKTLGEAVGLQVPNSKDYDPEAYKRAKDRAVMLEAANSYFMFCLQTASEKIEPYLEPGKGYSAKEFTDIFLESQLKTTGAENVMLYLISRGYSIEEVGAMELGYIPSQKQLFAYLKKKGFAEELLEQINIQHDSRIGGSHSLSIPFRSGGTLKGFKFRRLDEEYYSRAQIGNLEAQDRIELPPFEKMGAGGSQPKYLNSKGLDKIGGFFNLSALKGDNDLIIVEGELDALRATAAGLDNVVATAGSSINPEQVKDALRRGARSFTLCLDYERGKEQETVNQVNRAIQVITDEGVSRVYIASLPAIADKVDPDSLIRDKGIDALKKAIFKRKTYGAHLGESLYKQYAALAKVQQGIDYKDRDKLIEQTIQIRSTLLGINRVDFNRHLVEPLASHGFAEDILQPLEEDYKIAQEEAIKEQKIKSLLRDASGQKSPSEALKLLREGIKEVDIQTGRGLLPPELTFKGLLEDIASLPPAYRTGYPSLDKFIGFTPGAITLIAGRPSHGKTTFMFNLLLEMSRIYPEQRFIFFTYEEPVKNLSVKLLNRLTGIDLGQHYGDYPALPKHTNYEFLKAYIRGNRVDIPEIEQGKKLLSELIDSQRIRLIDVNYSVEQLSSLMAYLVKKERIGAILIDYVQRMRTDRRTQDKRTEIAHISDEVLQMAKQTGLPVILGAQLNRGAVSTQNKKPSLENLKEAGNLEEDANTVISIYNESREKEDSPEGVSYSQVREVELEIKALKNREGEPNQKALLNFDKWTGVIKDTTDTEDTLSF